MELSLLLARVLTDQEVREELHEKINEIDPFKESVSFAYLLNHHGSLKKNELEFMDTHLKSSNNQNLFKSAFSNEYFKNHNDYVNLVAFSEKLVNDKLKSSSLDPFLSLNEALVKKNLQIYYPFDDDYSNDDHSIYEYYVSYATLDGSNTNEAFGRSSRNDRLDLLTIDNDFLDRNPAYIIVPIDPCDMPGFICDFEELFPINEVTSSLPPPITKGPVLLTYNINDENISESAILTSRIKSIKFDDTSWMGFGATHQKLTFLRGSADGISIAGNNISVSGNKYQFKSFRIRRMYVRQSKWLQFNAEFDPDWTKIESMQSMAVFSIHKNTGSASTTLSGKANVKVENGKAVYSAENAYSVSIPSDKIPTSTFRNNVELSRRQVVSSIIGKGTTGKSRLHDGHEWNLKRIGIIEYYFYHYYHDLSN